MKNRIIIIIIIGLTIIVACKSKSVESDHQDKPNIIFIMADDHAFQAISAYGSDLIKTPNIDQLASEGMLFNQAFVTNSICSPSRAVVLTGKFSHLNGVKDNMDVFDPAQITFPKILQNNGYQTAIVGKWHLKSPPTGFDFWKVLPGQGNYYHPEFKIQEGKVKENGYVTDVITDIAIKFIDSIRDDSKPFMLMYHHKAPHRQWWPSMEELETFKTTEFPEPSTLFDDYKNRGAAAMEAEMRISDHMGLSCDNKIRPEILEELDIEEFFNWYKNEYRSRYNRLTEEEKKKWDEVYGPINSDFENNPPGGDELTSWKFQRYMHDYLASISSVDKNIGRLLNYLDEHGLTENTMIIYTSDQGFYLGEHGWFDKRFMYEPSFRTPLIIKWPGRIDENQTNDKLVQNLDFAPTILDAAGADIPEEMQGMSLLPVLTGDTPKWRDALYYHYYEYPSIHMVKRHYGVRTDKFKLIHFYYDVDEWELYDLTVDPDEMNNVYDHPDYSGVRQSLHRELEDLRNQYHDSDELTLELLQKDLDRLNK